MFFNMASCRAKHYTGVEVVHFAVSVILLLNCVLCSVQDDHNWIAKSPGTSGRIKLRNFDGKHQRRTVEITDEGYLTDNRQEAVSPKQLGGIVIQTESEKLSAGLRWLSNDEIGITKMQAIFDSLPYSRHPNSEKKKLLKITKRLGERFNGYLRVLRTIKITVQHLYSFHLKQAITQPLNCCNLPYRDFKSDPAYGCRISRATSCDLIPPSARPGDFNPGRNLTEGFRMISAC